MGASRTPRQENPLPNHSHLTEFAGLPVVEFPGLDTLDLVSAPREAEAEVDGYDGETHVHRYSAVSE